jgi:hypothetical protein
MAFANIQIERLEWARRVGYLIFERGMTARSAQTVVDAAMYGIGCLGTVHKQIQEENSRDAGQNLRQVLP